MIFLYTYSDIQCAPKFPAQATMRNIQINYQENGMWNSALINNNTVRNTLFAQLMKDRCIKHPVSLET